MAPMALFEVSKITKQNYGRHIEKGLAWIYGSNELRQNMISKQHYLIWRCMWMGMRKRKVDLTRAVLGIKPNLGDNKLDILCECRPYHLGWLLYAFSDKV